MKSIITALVIIVMVASTQAQETWAEWVATQGGDSIQVAARANQQPTIGYVTNGWTNVIVKPQQVQVAERTYLKCFAALYGTNSTAYTNAIREQVEMDFAIACDTRPELMALAGVMVPAFDRIEAWWTPYNAGAFHPYPWHVESITNTGSSVSDVLAESPAQRFLGHIATAGDVECVR